MNSEQRYILALSFIKGFGDNRIKNLITYAKSAQNVWEGSKDELMKINGIGPKLISEIGKSKYLEQ